MSYPTDRAERHAARLRIHRQFVAEAEIKALRHSRSITCAERKDHSTCAGAKNCLCPCHDPQETEA